MVTLFALPKAFQGHNNMIQRNALESWRRIDGNPQIILFGDDEGVPEVANELNLEYGGSVSRTENGTPRVDDLFMKGETFARYELVVYCNADIILPPDFAQILDGIAKQFDKMLVIGQRWDLDIRKPVDFSDERWLMRLKSQALREGCLHRQSGVDYFAFRRGLYPFIPPMAIGRVAWDNWLVIEARKRGAAIVDATEAIFAVHQEHDYAHGGGREEIWKGVEAKRNLALAGIPNGLAGWIQNAATWRLRANNRLIPAAKTPDKANISRQTADWTSEVEVITSLIETGKIAEALQRLDNAEGYASQPGLFHYMRGVALAHLGRHRQAIEACRQALSIEPILQPASDLIAQLEKKVHTIVLTETATY